MIIVKLFGGLGNQLFQYAAARRLSLVNNTTLKLDLSSFDLDPLRAYSLRPFNIQATVVNKVEILAVRQSLHFRTKFLRRFSRLERYLNRVITWNLVQESQVGPVNQSVLDVKGNVYMDGYWQSETYFVDKQNEIASDLVIQSTTKDTSRWIAEQIATTNSVAVHVRRGDYVSNPSMTQVHGICDLAYYSKCVQIIAERVASPHFFVFSDDPTWCSENMKLEGHMTLVSHNSPFDAHEDLKLMTLCKHQIIANSTFSWWGAWLNQNPNKIVLAPNRWFNRNLDTRDLLPEEWIKV